jgi:hypothetical protein
MNYGVLKKFLEENRSEYEVEEDQAKIVITFMPAAASAKGKLGESTYMRLYGEKRGDEVAIVKLTVIEEDQESEVSVESLDGWLDYVKNVY